MSSQNKYSPLQQRINDEMNEKYSPSFQRQESSTAVLDSKEEYELPKAFIQGGHQQMRIQNKYSLLQQRINDEMNEKYSPSFQRQDGSTALFDSKEEYELPKAFIQGGHQQMSSQNKYSLLQQRINDGMNEKYSPSFQRQDGSTALFDEIDSNEEYKD
jgi:hypothetical protein